MLTQLNDARSNKTEMGNHCYSNLKRKNIEKKRRKQSSIKFYHTLNF